MRILSTLWLLYLCSCAGTVSEIAYDGPTLPVEVIALGHVDVRLQGATAWQKFEKLHDVLQVLEAADALDAVAPFEFERASRLMDPRDYLRFTTLGVRMDALGVQGERIVVLEVEMEEGLAQQHTAMDTHKEILEARQVASEMVVRVRALHPGSNQILGSIQLRTGEDRFLDVPDYDARPMGRVLVQRAVRTLLSELESEDVIQPAAPELEAPEARTNPAAVLTFGKPGETLAEHLAILDEVTREAEQFKRFRYFDPEMSFGDYRRLSGLPPGVLVGENLVTEADGVEVRYRFQWMRIWRRGRPATLKGPGGALVLP